MEKYIKLLERLGIGEKISRVYLDLLEHGTSSIADVSRRSELHRIEVYRAIPYLEEEKLITPIQRGKRTLYRPLSPEGIHDMIRDFERRNAPVMDELMNKYEKLWKNISISYQEWASGVTRVFDDIIDTLPNGSVFYRISAENDVAKSNTYLPKNYRERRDKKWLERMVISSSKAALPKQKRLERDIVVIPKEYDEFDQDVTMTIYGDKVAFIDFGEENSIIIENPMIADFQKKLFKLLYKKLKK
jgi:sugar-specific transcriptional regulator TrmB